jgi:PAS domain S-box-containing protein
MSEILNILVVEDSNADFLMVERHLKQHGLSVHCSRVDTLKGLKEAIGDAEWDLVLSDYNIPQLLFPEILNFLQGALPDLPVIMVTGTVGEEKAVEFLKLGVFDFVLKGSLARLVPAIERTLTAVAERKAKLETEQALQNSEAHFRSIFNRSPVAIGIGKLTSGLFVDANDAMLQLYGYERHEMVGRTTDELKLYVRPDERMEIIRLVREFGHLLNREVQVRRKTGEILIVLYSAELIELRDGPLLQVMLTDITERKKLEDQIRQSHKMYAVGQLAGGVAHDFNNILSAIYGYSYLILGLAKENEPVKKYVNEILKASARAAELTGTLLTFSKKQAVTLVEIDLRKVLQENEAFLRRLIREDIELEILCAEESQSVLADRGQIEQVIMNLVANARDAMPNGGTITIDLAAVIMDRKFIALNEFGTAGPYVRISVSDNGVGIDKDTQRHIFEPFFTTKEQGKGTGLGLSMAYGIVKKHDGFIDVDSVPGTGTTFTIYLPRVSPTIQTGNSVPGEVTEVPGGSETILVCEDDPIVLKLTTEVLTLYGYRVMEAVDGQDAMEKYVENREQIDLIILDAIMPKMNGRKVFQEMRSMCPDLKVVITSGYGGDVFTDGCGLDDNSTYIQKPYSPDDLVATIREMLDKKRAMANRFLPVHGALSDDT